MSGVPGVGAVVWTKLSVYMATNTVPAAVDFNVVDTAKWDFVILLFIPCPCSVAGTYHTVYCHSLLSPVCSLDPGEETDLAAAAALAKVQDSDATHAASLSPSGVS